MHTDSLPRLWHYIKIHKLLCWDSSLCTSSLCHGVAHQSRGATVLAAQDEWTTSLFNIQGTKPKYVQNVEQHQHVKKKAECPAYSYSILYSLLWLIRLLSIRFYYNLSGNCQSRDKPRLLYQLFDVISLILLLSLWLPLYYDYYIIITLLILSQQLTTISIKNMTH